MSADTNTPKVSSWPLTPATRLKSCARFRLAACILGLIATGTAAEIKLSRLKIGMVEYQDATVTLENRFRAKIVHSSGVARLATADLPTDLQNQLGVLKEAPAPKPTTVSISKIKDPKELEGWFNKVVQKEGWNIESDITVRQSTGVGKLVEIDLSSDLVMLVGDNEDRADGSMFKAIIKDSGRTYEYTTVLGANKKVRPCSVQTPVTIATFKELLKSGMTYKVTENDQVTQCLVCEGRPVPCKQCDNTGLTTGDRVIEIRWD